MKTLRIILAVCLGIWSIALNAQEKYSVSQLGDEVRPALLVIDIQNDFLPHMSEEDRKTAMDTINQAIAVFHARGLPVIRIYHHDAERGPHPGSEGFEYPKSVEFALTDPKVIKQYEDGFAKTWLDSLLRKFGVNLVFLCGLSATGCVLGTYFGALDHDYLAVMIGDGLISPKTEHTAMIREICRTVGLKTVRNMVNRKR